MVKKEVLREWGFGFSLGFWGVIFRSLLGVLNLCFLRAKKIFFKKLKNLKLKMLSKNVLVVSLYACLRGLYLFILFFFFAIKGVTGWVVLSLLWDAIGRTKTHYSYY